MSGFKLLAIRPLKDCDVFIRNLQINEIYQFYNYYNFIEKDGVIENIEHNTSNEIDLYSSNNLGISISAIVGKNGSGKSSLFELFYASIYILSIKLKHISSPDDKINKELYQSIEKNLKVEIFFLINSNIYSLEINKEDKNSVKLKTYLKSDLENNRIEIVNYRLSEISMDNDIIMSLSTNFFYSIVVNYSIYGLNSREIGSWINELFHKNDGYKTPIVINPMRSEGNFDINDESYLLKSRLLSNILTLDRGKLIFSEIIENKIVSKLIFKLNESKISNIYEDYTFSENPIIYNFDDLYRIYGGGDSINGESEIISLIYDKLIKVKETSINSIFKNDIERYIIKKLFKIARTFNEYKKYLSQNLETTAIYSSIELGNFPCFIPKGLNSFWNYLNSIDNDDTHITFKLRQAINFLRHGQIYSDDVLFLFNDNLFEFTTVELAKKIKSAIKKSNETILFIPPSIFDVSIMISDLSQKNKEYSLSKMSSGELQLINSVQSILYHIRNIDSVHNKSRRKNKVRYENINILIDEVELYFHPDYQRKFISYLLKGLENLKINQNRKNKLKNINFIFSTHSPFILSDIPSENILKLIEGKPIQNKENEQTFGANIHHLLANDFFLSDTMGEFATSKVNDIINFYYEVCKADKNNLISIKEEFSLKKPIFEYVIDNIGEKVTKAILINHVEFINQKLG